MDGPESTERGGPDFGPDEADMIRRVALDLKERITCDLEAPVINRQRGLEFCGVVHRLRELAGGNAGPMEEYLAGRRG